MYEPHLTEETHPTDSLRLMLIAFLRDYWATVGPQLSCPAKNLIQPADRKALEDPRPCFKCSDMQVITCLVHNRHNEETIQRYHPKGRGQQ